MRRTLLALSAIASLAYFVTQPWQPFHGSVLLKGLTISPLAALAFLEARRHGSSLGILGTALALSSAGDVLLDLDPDLFPAGLGAFLLAHVGYATLWLRYRPRPFRLTPGRTAIEAAVLLYAIGFGAWIIPGLGELSGPVALYIFAITVMVMTATASIFPISGVATGAVLVLISDTVLAINKFKFEVPGRGVIVWSTYYAAQLLMATTVIRMLTRPAPAHDTLRAGDPDVHIHSTHSA